MTQQTGVKKVNENKVERKSCSQEEKKKKDKKKREGEDQTHHLYGFRQDGTRLLSSDTTGCFRSRM